MPTSQILSHWNVQDQDCVLVHASESGKEDACTMYISLVLKSAIFENGKYQHFFAGDFAQGSRVRKGDLAKYRSFHENWVPLLEFSSASLQPFSPL